MAAVRGFYPSTGAGDELARLSTTHHPFPVHRREDAVKDRKKKRMRRHVPRKAAHTCGLKGLDLITTYSALQ